MSDRLNKANKAIYVDVSPNPNHIHTNGSSVRGHVSVDPSKRPQRVNIAFKGREKCIITQRHSNGSTIYKEKPVYFAYELELFLSATRGESYDIVSYGIAENNRVEFPFEFRFPDAMQIQQKPPDKWPENAQFISKAGQLPPSCHFFHRHSSDVQIVEYYLEARLYTDARNRPALEVRQPVIFRPQYLRTPALFSSIQMHKYQTPRAICIRTHKIHPKYDPNEGFKDRMKHRLTKNKEKTPYTTFQLKAECPSIVTLGNPVHLTLSLAHLERSEDLPAPPPIFLRRIVIRVESRMLVRIPIISFFQGPELNDAHSDKTDLLNIEFNEGNGLLLYDGLSVKTKKWPVQLSPPFKSYGLNLEQTMNVKIWGECGGDKFERRLVHGKLLDVLVQGVDSGEEPGVTREEIMGEDVSMLPPSVDNDVAPPPYQVLRKS